jgi:hypothetical protein
MTHLQVLSILIFMDLFNFFLVCSEGGCRHALACMGDTAKLV